MASLTVQYTTYDRDEALRPNVFTCPWCGVENAYQAPGEIAWVTKL